MKRLSKKQMWIFAVGQFGWSLLSGIISAWLVTFYLPTKPDMDAGAINFIQPGLIIGGFLTILGLITSLSRVFDAVTDPLIANMSDRCKSRFGRRIPFMFIAAVPLAIVTVLLFCAPFGAYDKGGNVGNIIWISVFIVLFYTFMTMYCTPYNALISEFGKTQEDRMFISTAISLTFFAGTMIAYLPFVVAGPLRDAGLSYNFSYQVCFIVLAVIAAVAMLLPAILLKEKDFVDTKPSNTNAFKSLGATFKNKSFRLFVGSDIMYWVGLTLFQTGLPFFVKVSMQLDEFFTMVFLGAMTVLSACFYPLVGKLVKKFGKKKLVIAGFLGLALAYVITAVIQPIKAAAPEFPSIVFGVSIVVLAAFPMALLGVIPQAIVADVAEEDSINTKEDRQGMFFAARTFAMKFGQALAMLLFTSLAIIGTTKGGESEEAVNEITASSLGLTIVAIVAIVFCVLGAVVLLFYNEKKVMQTITQKEETVIAASENEKELGQKASEETVKEETPVEEVKEEK